MIAALLVLLALVAPKTSLPDVEDEVMCVQCGTPLNVSQSPVADQERALIRREIARGATKAQVKAALVREYGTEVLAEPSGGSFDWAAWAVPVALAVAALAGLAAAARARRRRRGPAPNPRAPALDPEDQRRLDAELAAFDR